MSCLEVNWSAFWEDEKEKEKKRERKEKKN